MLVLLICGRDLSNNHIGGSIPSSLPITLQNLYVFPVTKQFVFFVSFIQILNVFCALGIQSSHAKYTLAVFFQLINLVEASQLRCPLLAYLQTCKFFVFVLSFFLFLECLYCCYLFYLSFICLNNFQLFMPFRSLNDNLLTGEIPDAFLALVGLINLYGLVIFCNIYPSYT